MYLRSISNTPIMLNITTVHWVLSNSHNEVVYGPADKIEHLRLNWDYNSSTIDPGQTIPVVFTIRADYTLSFIDYVIKNDVQQFSFNVNVRAFEANEH
jgi:hypothetical protein